MDILSKISQYAVRFPDRPAVKSNTDPFFTSLTYEQLDAFSGRLAFWLEKKLGNDRHPLLVYGHKSPFMLVYFLACVKSGRAYCPVDTFSVPCARVKDIIEQTGTPLVLATEPLSSSISGSTPILDDQEAMSIILRTKQVISPDLRVCGSDVWYIIFTSGSTGKPKGVQITSDCLNHFLDWSVTLLNRQTADAAHCGVFINQAPFSFDLSVMDLYTSLATGSTLWTLNKACQNDMRSLYASLEESEAEVWVSTPSFAELCLADPVFSQALLPRMNCFIFCGETLSNTTVSKLHDRFPGSKVINTYGPTETTVAVTGVTITPQLNSSVSPLPVGAEKPGTSISIMSEDGILLPDGQKGEIIISGDTVGAGYFGRPDLTQKSFFLLNGTPSYHTGDEGYLKDGQLYYCGRIDLQIKMHGYRIEIEDIESNLLKLEGLKKAVVIPVMKDDAVKSLCAFLVAEDSVSRSFASVQEIRHRLAEFLPAYMIPKKICFLDSIPMTGNGKADRKALRGMLQ